MHNMFERDSLMGVKLNVKCHKCGAMNIVNIEPVEENTICEITFVCSTCGALNNLFYDPNDPDPEKQEWLCIPPQGFEWVLPAGKIMPIVGDAIYVSAFGEHLSRRIYIERYKLDPEIAYQYMRRKRNEQMGSDMIDKASQSTASKITNNLSQSVASNPVMDLSNIQKIEILCKNCYRICELNLSRPTCE
jgi:hypothetical protein